MLVPLALRAVTSLNRDMIPTARKVATRQDIGRICETIQGERYFRYESTREKGRLCSTRSSRRLTSSYTANRVKKVAAHPARTVPKRPRMYRSSVVRNIRKSASKIRPTSRKGTGSDGLFETSSKP